MYQDRESLCSSNYGSRVYSGPRAGHGHGGRRSPPAGRRHGRPHRRSPLGSYHESYRPSSHARPRMSGDWDVDRPASRFSARYKHSARSMHPAPSIRQPSRCTRSVVSGAASPAPWPLRGMRGADLDEKHAADLGEKHASPPYDTGYSLASDDRDDELVALERSRWVRRMTTRAAYGVLCFLVVLACALLGYFLAPRTPDVALHAVGSPASAHSGSFKLRGAKLQFHVDLVYRVQNDNYFGMVVDDISTAVFWPETKFALGGGRLSNIWVPARRTVEITMPVAIRYDVKRGPPPVLLGMVDSCGLHDAGIGEMSLEAEVQADFHTKIARSLVQSGRQSISIKCPVRRMGTLQIDDGASGNLGDLVRTLSA